MAYTLAPFNPSTPYQNQVATELNTANTNFTILGQAFYNNDPTSQPILRASHIGSSAPSNPVAGMTWLDTSTTPPVLKVYDGSNWQSNVSNSNAVNNFPANLTPVPNTIVPLNSSGILDLSSTYIKSNVYTFRRVDLSNASSDYTMQVGEEVIINFNNASSVALHIATTSTALYWLYCSAGGCSLNPNNTTYSSSFYWVDWGVNYDGSNVSAVNNGVSDKAFALGNGGGTGFIVSYIDIKNTKTITQQAFSSSSAPYSVRHTTCHWKNPASWTSLGTITFSNSSSGYILIRRLA